MKCLTLLIPIFLLLLGHSHQSKTKTTNLQRLSRAHLEFALSLFKKVAEDTRVSENVILSPFSAASVLSQLWLGSGKNSTTFQELEKVLRYSDGGLSPQKVHDVFHTSLETLDDPDFASVVKQANSLFIQKGVPIQASFKKDLQHYYNASVQQVNFLLDPEEALRKVNAWVSKRTQGLIPNLIDAPLSPDTKMLLVNALSLKAYWKNSFDPTTTAANGIFHQDKDTKIEVPMMAGKFKVPLGESDTLRCKLLELPFRGKRMSMFVLLPDEEESTTHLEKNLNAQNLKKLFFSLREEMVHIRMPRFSVDQSTNLAESLRSLGLSEMFDSSHANFSRISTSADEPLRVSSLAHKVTLEITEKGARGSAASATGIERFGEVGEFFEINRPFIFFIWDYYSGAVLFIGRIAAPTPLLN